MKTFLFIVFSFAISSISFAQNQAEQQGVKRESKVVTGTQAPAVQSATPVKRAEHEVQLKPVSTPSSTSTGARVNPEAAPADTQAVKPAVEQSRSSVAPKKKATEAAPIRMQDVQPKQ